MLTAFRPAFGRSLLLRSQAAGVAASQHFPSLATAVRSISTKPEEEDTHDDFKPVMKAQPAGGVEETIKADISGNKVFVYMKGVPEAPMCGFSNMACRILNAYGVEFGSRNVLEDPEIREGVKKFSEWPTIPQVFIDGEFVGGSDILMGMHQTGELQQVLEKAGVVTKS